MKENFTNKCIEMGCLVENKGENLIVKNSNDEKVVFQFNIVDNSLSFSKQNTLSFQLKVNIVKDKNASAEFVDKVTKLWNDLYPVQQLN